MAERLLEAFAEIARGAEARGLGCLGHVVREPAYVPVPHWGRGFHFERICAALSVRFERKAEEDCRGRQEGQEQVLFVFH